MALNSNDSLEAMAQERKLQGWEGRLAPGWSGTAGVPLAMSPQREQLGHSTFSADVADAGETPAIPVEREHATLPYLQPVQFEFIFQALSLPVQK